MTMNNEIKITCAIFLLFVFSAISAPQPAASEEMSVPIVILSTGVVERIPVGEAVVFPADVGNVYCYTTVSGSSSSSQIRHVWYYEGKEVFSLPLPVKAANWRTWSSKKINRAQKGSWRVEIIDETDGKLLNTAFFSVQ
jgi:hypothetical protein